MGARCIAVADCIVVEMNKEYKSGVVRIFEPVRSELGFGYATFNDSEVMTLPLIVTVGRQCRCEIWNQVRTLRHEARNLWFYAEEDLPDA